jgi:uroporphyrinogen-III synthase
MARVLVTRPIEEAKHTARALAKLGHEALIDPMLTIAFRHDELPAGSFDTVIVTSGNALAALRQRSELAGMLDLPLLAVGRRTAASARAMGFKAVETLGRDLDALIDHVRRAWTAPRHVLYLAGADRTGDLAACLTPGGHRVTLTVVYEAHQAQQFDPAVEQALRGGKVDVVLHYSARTADAFIACLGGRPGLAAHDLRHLCLSRKVASVLAEAGAAKVAFASRPEEDALLALI